MVKFKIMVPGGSVTEYAGTYKITDAGVVTVMPETGNPFVLSPAAWLCIELLDAPTKSAYEERGLLIV